LQTHSNLPRNLISRKQRKLLTKNSCTEHIQDFQEQNTMRNTITFFYNESSPKADSIGQLFI